MYLKYFMQKTNKEKICSSSFSCKIIGAVNDILTLDADDFFFFRMFCNGRRLKFHYFYVTKTILFFFLTRMANKYVYHFISR